MNTQHSKGFTLVELMIVIAITSIVLSIGIPEMQVFIKNDRLVSTSNSLLGDLMLARSKAVEQNLPTILCSTNNQTSCTDGNLEDGWLVGIDEDESGSIETGETLIKIAQAVGSDIQITSSFGSLINYDSRGFTPDTIGTLTIQDGRGSEYAKSLTINRTGRVSR